MTVKAGKTDYMVLVNRTHPVPDDWYETLETVRYTNQLNEDVIAEKETLCAFLGLKEALENENVFIDLDCGLRTVEDQKRIAEDFLVRYGPVYTSEIVAEPGYSEHHTGLALDVSLVVQGKVIVLNEELVRYPQLWVKVHARLADHGFILRYPPGKKGITGYACEPWHIRYIHDRKTARQIMSAGISLEEYLCRQ